MVDKGGDVHLLHVAAILGPDLDGGVDGDDRLPSITGDMVVDASLQSLQKGRFPVKTSPHDERDPLRQSHA